MASEVADFESRQECNHLDGLAQTHLIANDPPSLLTVQLPKPLDTSLLVPTRCRTQTSKGEGLQGIHQDKYYILENLEFHCEEKQKKCSRMNRLANVVGGIVA